MKEKPIKFISKQKTLYGILHEPQNEKHQTAFILLHGWGTYRIGPHRFFVDAARTFADDGFPCLRFDFRGRGESEGSVADTTLLDMIEDAHQAVEEILKNQDISQVILLGLCSGGEVAVGTAADNPKIKGVVLLSTPLLGRDPDIKEDVKKTANYAKSYWQKLFLPQTWKKIFSLRVNYKAVFRILFGHFVHQTKPHEKNSKITREAELLEKFRNFNGASLFIYGENDPVAAPSEKAYRDICEKQKNTTFKTIPGANHNFYSLEWKKNVINHISEWLRKENFHSTTPCKNDKK